VFTPCTLPLSRLCVVVCVCVCADLLQMPKTKMQQRAEEEETAAAAKAEAGAAAAEAGELREGYPETLDEDAQRWWEAQQGREDSPEHIHLPPEFSPHGRRSDTAADEYDPEFEGGGGGGWWSKQQRSGGSSGLGGDGTEAGGRIPVGVVGSPKAPRSEDGSGAEE